MSIVPKKTLVQTEITQYFKPRTTTYVQSTLPQYYPFIEIAVELFPLATDIESQESERAIGSANSLSRVFETPRSECRVRADQQGLFTRSQDTSVSRLFPTNSTSDKNIENMDVFGTSSKKRSRPRSQSPPTCSSGSCLGSI